MNSPSVLLVLLLVTVVAVAWLVLRWTRRRGAIPASTTDPVAATQLDTRHSLDAWRRAHRVFSEAVELSPGDRAAFLARQYGDDPAMLREVESLLKAHDSTGPLDRLRTRLELPGLSPGVDPERQPDADPPHTRDGNLTHDELIGGHYTLLGKLGEGGMGVVHRARDVRLARDVALKFLPPDRDSTGVARKRFILEAKAAAALDHPNICTVHEIGETPSGELFIAMALCEGETLAQRTARGPIHWEESLGIVQQVVSGLARAHDAGIVHRDIKPANICITTDGIVKIVDFGIAKVADTTLADAGPLLGTLAYMSPEMVSGEVVDHSTDLWSLGVVLYEMLTGTRLFPGGDWPRVLAAIRSDDPVPLGRLRGTAPWSVISLVRRMLSRRREDRLPDAESLESAVRVALEDAHRSAEPVADGEASLESDGERRHVTVVESRLVGRTGVMSPSGPGDADAWLLRLYESAAEIVRSHGGVLNQFGDGHMTSVFGIPITREDDAVRAGQAAFDLAELVSISEDGNDVPLAMHTGIASGTLEASLAGGTGTAMYELKGPPAVVARTLASMAAAGGILVCGDDCRTLSGRYVLEPYEGFVQGSGDRKLAVAALVGRRTVPEQGVPLVTGLTAFTGRERELDKLFVDLEGAMTGEGRVVTIIGEAGAGKSRLLHEFRRRLHGSSARLSIGSCVADSFTKPYFPIVEAMRHTLALDREAGGVEARELVARSVRGMSPDLEAFVPVYLRLFGIDTGKPSSTLPPDGQRARGAISEAVTAFFSMAASELPTVLLLEDFHWSDEASCQLLSQLCGISQSFPLLVIVTHRPGSDVSWNGAAAGSVIRLASLRLEDSSRMAHALLGMGAVPDDVARMLHERAGGNPFFLEELCRSLLESGTLHEEDGRVSLAASPDSLHLPGTVQGIVRSRLDRLSPDARDVVRAAAVLGRDFTLPLLERMIPDRYTLDSSLTTLTSLGITRQVRVVPERTFRFCHMLTREVAYDTLLPHQCRTLHREAARAIVAVNAGHLEDFAPVLAYHFSAGEEWFEAAGYGYVAARQTLGLGEYRHALSSLQDVDEWLARVPGGPERDELQVNVLLEQEELFEVLGDRERQSEILHRLLQIPRVVADKHRLAEVYRRLGDRYTVMREFSKARTALEEALRLTRESGDRTTESAVLRSLGLTGWYTGDTEAALPLIDAALAMERERSDYNAIATSLNSRSLILKDMGRNNEALRSIEEGLAILDRTTNDVASASVLTTAGTIYRTNGDVDQALHYLGLADEILVRRKLPVHESFVAAAKAHTYLARGDLNLAVEAAEQGVVRTRLSGFTDGLARSLCSLAELLAGTGREAEALPNLKEAAELFQQIGAFHMERPVRERLATIAERHGDPSVAREAWLRCRTLAEDQRDSAALVRAQLGVARSRQSTAPGERAESEAALYEALRLSREHGLADQELNALNSLGILEWERGSHEAALRHYEAAFDICRDSGDTINVGVILNSQAVCLRALGRTPEAREVVDEALEVSRQSGQRLIEAHALALSGELALDASDTIEARSLFTSSLELRRALNDRRGEGWMHRHIAQAAGRDNDVELALASLAAARNVADELNDAELAAACNEVAVFTSH